MQHTAPLFTTTACILLVLCAAHCGAVERMPLRGLLHKWPTAPGTAASAAPQLGAAEARTVNVIDYGADPSGKNDSSAAIQKAIQAAKDVFVSSTAGSGSLTVDLQGGSYRIDTTLDLSWAAGFVFSGGSLIAGPSFPNSSYIVYCRSCTKLMFRDLIVDNQHRGGGFMFSSPLQVQIDNAFFSHFATHGVYCNETGGHELLLANSFFEEFHWGEPGYNTSSAKTATAIELVQPDSSILNVIIRCAKKGIVSSSTSNLIESTHIYTTCNHADLPAENTICFDVKGARVIDSYVDNCIFRVTELDYGLVLSGTQFFGVAQLALAPQKQNAPLSGMRIVNNIFNSDAEATPRLWVDTSKGSLDAGRISNVTIADNNHARGTRATARVSWQGSLPAVMDVDLSGQLLFWPVDAAVSCVVMLDGDTCLDKEKSTFPLAACNIITSRSNPLHVKVNVFAVAPPPANCTGAAVVSVL